MDLPSPFDVTTEAREREERAAVYAQMQNPRRGGLVANFDEPNECNAYFPKASTGAIIDDSNCREKDQMAHGEIGPEGYNVDGPTKTPLVITHIQNPYTQHPTIDSNNLSWPSRWICWLEATD